MLIAGFPAGLFQANCYLVAPEPGGECVVVDTGQDALERLDALLAEHRLRPVAVLLTHGHLDHVASAAAVSAAHEVPVYLHRADDHLLDDPLAGLSPELKGLLAGMDLTGIRPPEVLPVSPGDWLKLAGLELAVDHTPGHTGGSVVFRVAGDPGRDPAASGRPEVLFTGDTLFAGSVGRTDLPGGSSEQLVASLAALMAARPDDAVVLPGHGATSTIGAERARNPYLR